VQRGRGGQARARRQVAPASSSAPGTRTPRAASAAATASAGPSGPPCAAVASVRGDDGRGAVARVPREASVGARRAGQRDVAVDGQRQTQPSL
jgi:hypothetical protein